MRRRERSALREALSIRAHRLVGRLRAEVRGEREPDAELARELRAVVARAEKPDRREAHVVGHAADRLERMIGRKLPVIEGHELAQLLPEIVGDEGLLRASERERGQLIRPRRATDPEVDPSGMERLEQAKYFAHLERRVVGQHHAARAETDTRGHRRDVRDHDLGRRGGDPGHVVVLGVPQTREPRPVERSRELARRAQRRGARTAGAEGNEIEGRERERHVGTMMRSRPRFRARALTSSPLFAARRRSSPLVAARRPLVAAVTSSSRQRRPARTWSARVATV